MLYCFQPGNQLVYARSNYTRSNVPSSLLMDG